MTIVTAQIQQSFFDRQKVIAQIGRKKARALGRAGAFVRRRARSSLRRAPKKRRAPGAGAGKPPRVRSSSETATLKNIQFGLRDDNEAVLIGPLKTNQKNQLAGSLTVPQLLEFGGAAGIREFRWTGSDVWLPGAPRRGRNTAEYESRIRRADYPAYPFMGPALDRELAAGTIDDVWR